MKALFILGSAHESCHCHSSLFPCAFFLAQEEVVFLDLYKRLCTMALPDWSNHVKLKVVLARDNVNS